MIEDEFYTDEKPASLMDWIFGLFALVGVAALVYAILLLASK
jgi:hypothetical protein